MSGHARLGPSDSARWMACPGSIQFTQAYPNGSTEAADEGTFAHWIREECLDIGFDAYDFIGRKRTINGVGYEWTDEDADALQPGIDEIREFKGQMFVEKRLDLGHWMPGQFGTLDCGIAGTELIVISDLKWGRGVAVQAANNTQQMIYALGFWDNIARHVTKAAQFLIIIDQPRHNAGGGYFTVSLDELLAFGETLKVKAAATYDANAPRVPSAYACQWCPAANMPGRAGGCPEHAQKQLADIDLDFEKLDQIEVETWQPPIVTQLTPERLIKLSLIKKSVEGFLDYAHAAALQHCMNYGPTAGVKAVEGRRPPRKWRNTAAAEAFMRQQLPSATPFNNKLKTPSQAESEVGKKYEIPMALIERGQPKPVLVSVDDARSAIQSVESEFDEVRDDLEI